MAIGTITLGTQVYTKGGVFIDECTMVGDGAYPTGGSTGFQAAFQAKTLDGRVIDHIEGYGLNGGYAVIWDKANGKLLTEVKSSGVETANATDLSGTTFKLRVFSH